MVNFYKVTEINNNNNDYYYYYYIYIYVQSLEYANRCFPSLGCLYHSKYIQH